MSLETQGQGWISWDRAAQYVNSTIMPAFFFAGQVCHIHPADSCRTKCLVYLANVQYHEEDSFPESMEQ
jgi:hypothetical protein